MELEGTALPKHLERPVPGPERRVRVPPVQLLLEQLLVMTGEPLGEFVLVFDLDQVDGVLLFDLGQAEVCEVGDGSAALIQSTKDALEVPSEDVHPQ